MLRLEGMVCGYGPFEAVHGLDLEAHPCTLNLPVTHQVVGDLHRPVDRDREAEPLAAAAARDDRRVDPDHLADRVH